MRRRAHVALVGRRLRRLIRRLLFRLPPLHLRGLEIFFSQLAAAYGQRIEARETRRHRFVGQRVGPKLLIDVFVETDLPHAIDVARRGTKSQAVQDMQDGLVIWVLRNSGRGRSDDPGWWRAGSDQDQAERACKEHPRGSSEHWTHTTHLSAGLLTSRLTGLDKSRAGTVKPEKDVATAFVDVEMD